METKDLNNVEQQNKLTLRQDKILDRAIGKLLSRKLTVFLLTTLFLTTGKITNEQWVYVAILYIGSQTIIDFAEKLKKSGF